MRYLFLFLLLLLGACSTSPTPTPTPLPPTATSLPPTAAPTSASTPTVESAEVSGTPTPLPTLQPAYVDVTLPRLAERTHTAGPIETTETLTVTDAFTTSLVTYTSDGLKITGLLNVPAGDGKFPAVVLVHGYVSPDQYVRGLDAQNFAEELARHGYISFVPDLRGYEESDHGMNLFISGFIADAINAGSALKQDPRVDAEHVGLWGHSMGGGVATRVMVVSDMFDSAVLYAPLSGNMEDMFMDPFGGEPQGVTEELIQGVIAALDNPDFRKAISPENYWDKVNVPISIHVGTEDKVTPAVWSRAIRDGLKAAGKDVEYFEYPGEGHSIGQASQAEFFKNMLAFFDRTLK